MRAPALSGAMAGTEGEMSDPKVTVLMPCRDVREDWLRIAISGIARQTYPNLVLAIGDDGSMKASRLAVLKEAKERWPDRVRVARRPESGGTAHALDVAMSIADEDTVYFSKADADDIFHKDREANRVRLFERLPPQVAIVYDNYFQIIYQPRPHAIPVILRPYDYRALLDSSYIHGNSMWRASVYDKIPRTFVYDGYEGKANRHGEDYNLWLNITDHYDGFWMNCDPAFSWTYRVYPDSKYMKDRKGVDYCRSLLQHRAKERRGLL